MFLALYLCMLRWSVSERARVRAVLVGFVLGGMVYGNTTHIREMTTSEALLQIYCAAHCFISHKAKHRGKSVS
jgi:hypothetical protein